MLVSIFDEVLTAQLLDRGVKPNEFGSEFSELDLRAYNLLGPEEFVTALKHDYMLRAMIRKKKPVALLSMI